MGQLKLEGTLIAGPPDVNSGFPSMQITTPFATRQSPKLWGVATGVLYRSVNVSSPSFGALQGVGATDTVTKGDFLYIKSSGPVLLRLTQDDGSGGNNVRLLDIDGLTVLEFSTSKHLKLLEVQGMATIEYFVSGQS